MNPRIQFVTPEENFKLRVTFTDNSIGVFDCSSYLNIGVFKELQNPQYFNQVQVSDGTVVWPHEQDFCPDTIYLESIQVNQQAEATA